MFPWYWIWNPQVHWPLSGSVTQDIKPELDWFFEAIPSSAGKGKLEQQIFKQYSYGRQLGIVLEVLKPLVEQAQLDTTKNVSLAHSLSQFEALTETIEQHKREHYEELRANAVEQLDKLREADPEALKQLLASYQA